MKICIAGKNNIASDILEYLIFKKGISKNDILVCCTKNDAGKNGWQRSLRFTADLLGVKEVKLEELYDISDLVFLSLEFDRIVRPALFKTNKLFNIHFSLLPKYKGMNTAIFPILNNEKYGGVTFHKIDNGIDTGEIIAQKRFVIDSEDTSRCLYLKNLNNGTQLVKECIDKYLSCNFECSSIAQSVEESSYYSNRSIDYGNIQIDLHQTALYIHNQIRAYNFREYQLPVVFGKKIRFCEITKNRSAEKSGSIIWQNDDCMMIATIDYDVVLYVDKFDEVLESCKNNDVDALRRIFGLQYYLNEKEEHGWTPLTIAIYNGYYDLAMFLIAVGADIHVINNNGTNLLMYAKDAFVNNGDSRLFEYLYRKGLSLDKSDYSGKTLRYYCDNQNINDIAGIAVCTKLANGGGYNCRVVLNSENLCSLPLVA